MVPEGLNAFGGPLCMQLRRQLAFLASGKAKNGLFSLRIAHIAHSFFYTIGTFFSDGPKGFEFIIGLCACSLRAAN